MIKNFWGSQFGLKHPNGNGIKKTKHSLPLHHSMSCGGGLNLDFSNRKESPQNGAISLHAFSDLSQVSPAIFVYLLKEGYVYGTNKATSKFRVLQQQVLHALITKPHPGPAVFIIQCLYILPLLGPPYTEGFSHLLISCFHRLKKMGKVSDSPEAKYLAAKLFLDILDRFVAHEDRILVKILEVFDIKPKDVGEVICGPHARDEQLDAVRAHIGRYVYNLIESQSYMTVVTLLERFSIMECADSSYSFLDRMIQDSQFKAAEKWATLMGKPMICLLIQKYADMNMLKNAYDMIKTNDLKEEFPEVYQLYKQSSLKKFAQKGCWDVAEIKTNNDRELLIYLVYLAMEAGYTEKVDELCERHSLSGFINFTEPETNPSTSCYLQIKETFVEDILWVDEFEVLLSATAHIEGCKVIGVDCEWKPNYVKGSKPSKVSIIQIASEKTVFIFDLIKLYGEHPQTLDSCFKRILHSSEILKLGYNLQCDLHQLSTSYGDLECFRYYEMLLDIQKLFKDQRGGLSGLAEKILGAGLNKTRRNSNWEQRPLSQNQMEYAALDAAVLLQIFCHVKNQPHNRSSQEEESKIEWKSHIMGKTRKTKNTS